VAFIGLEGDILGRSIGEVMSRKDLAELGESVRKLAAESGGSFEEVDLSVGGGHRIRISNQALAGENGQTIGRVILFKEISHEPLTGAFEEVVGRVSGTKGAVREVLENALTALAELETTVSAARIDSANMSELVERVSRTRTAIGNWLDVDDALVDDEFPDAQLLRDRLNVASQRWPRSEPPPERVVELMRAVEEYYETGENARVRIL
jgi:hypothetical protein